MKTNINHILCMNLLKQIIMKQLVNIFGKTDPKSQSQINQSVEAGDAFIWAAIIFSLLMLFSCESHSQSHFNTYSVTDSVDIAYVQENTTITLTEGSIHISSNEYEFKDMIVSQEQISPTKAIYTTQSNDQFIFIGIKDMVYQVKWIPSYGGMISFFNLNVKK